MKFVRENSVTVFMDHTTQVESIGIAANEAAEGIVFERPEVFRTKMIEMYGNGTIKSYVPKIQVTIDNDGYIEFAPQRKEVKEYFSSLRKFNWEAMSTEDIQIAAFEYLNMSNGKAQVIIDDNKKLTGFKSNSRKHNFKLLGMQKLQFIVNINGKITQDRIDEMNKELTEYDNQKWVGIGTDECLIVKIDMTEADYVFNGKDYFADPNQHIRLMAIKYLELLFSKMFVQYKSVKYNSQDSARIREIRGNGARYAIAANVVRSLFGEYYGISIFEEELRNDIFDKQNEEEDLRNDFASLEMKAELSDNRQKGFAVLENMILNVFSDLPAIQTAAHIFMAAKYGKVNNEGSTVLTTLLSKHAYLLNKEFFIQDEEGEYSEIEIAKYAGVPIQLFNNEVFEDGEKVEHNGTQIIGYTSTMSKPMKFEGNEPELFVKYFNDKPYVAYDLIAYLEQAIQEDVAKATQNPKVVLSIDFKGALAEYNKESTEIKFGDAEPTVKKVREASLTDSQFVIQFSKGDYKLYAKEDGDKLTFLADLKTQKDKKFGVGALEDYLHRAVIVSAGEDYTAVLRDEGVRKGRLAMMLMGEIVERYDGDFPNPDEEVEVEIEYSTKLKSVVLSGGNKGNKVFGNIFGKLQFEVTKEDDEKVIIGAKEEPEESVDTEEDELGHLYEENEEYEEEDEEYDVEIER